MHRSALPAAALLAMIAGASAQTPVDTGWTYQGTLSDAGAPAQGPYDFRFTLFIDDQGVLQTGPVLDQPSLEVDQGLFTAHLDFGAQFTGYKNWLQVEISPAGQGAYTALPLQEITSAPQSLFSLAPWATDPSYNISYSNGLVGIGRSPEYTLDVVAGHGKAKKMLRDASGALKKGRIEVSALLDEVEALVGRDQGAAA